jgi:hypothetical protein
MGELVDLLLIALIPEASVYWRFPHLFYISEIWMPVTESVNLLLR